MDLDRKKYLENEIVKIIDELMLFRDDYLGLVDSWTILGFYEISHHYYEMLGKATLNLKRLNNLLSKIGIDEFNKFIDSGTKQFKAMEEFDTSKGIPATPDFINELMSVYYDDIKIKIKFIDKDQITQDEKTIDQIKFNNEEAELFWGKKTINFFINRNEHLLLKELFKKPSERIEEIDIYSLSGWSNPDGGRSVYDTVERINKKIGNKFIKYGNGHIWIDNRYKNMLI